jgi:hypothetical protein
MEAKCQRHLITNGRCAKRGFIVRNTGIHKITLCKKCDAKFGEIIGEIDSITNTTERK